MMDARRLVRTWRLEGAVRLGTISIGIKTAKHEMLRSVLTP